MPHTEALDAPLIVEKSTTKAWIVCLTASLFFFYEFVQIMMFNSINPELMATFHVTAAATGRISASYFIANILFMFPAGMILDRCSTKKIILLAMVTCIVGTTLFSFAQTVGQASFFRFITGMGGAFPFLCCLRLALRWFPPRRLALVSGVTVTIAMLGGVAGQAPLQYVVTQLGWRHALQVDVLLGVVFTLLIYFNVSDYPAHLHKTMMRPLKPLAIRETVILTLKNKQNWVFGLYTCFLNLPIMILGAIWGSLYLTQMIGLSREAASLVTSMIFFGTIFGAPVLGLVSDMLGRRLLPMRVAAILSLILVLIIIFDAHLSFLALLSLFFLLGFMTSAQVISYPAISESTSHDLSGSALGFASVLIMLGPALFQPFFGWLLDYHGDHVLHHGIPYYTAQDYRLALFILPLTFIAGIVLTFFARETYCRHEKRMYNQTERQ